MRKSTFTVAAIAAAFAAMPANAVVIDFDNFGNTYTTGAYFEDGYKLSSSLCGATSTCFRAQATATSIDSDGTSVVRAGGGTATTVERADGGLFEFVSMDFGKTNTTNNTASSTYEFVFTLADATTISKFFSFNWNNPSPVTTNIVSFGDLGQISKFTFRNASTAAQFDNIVLNNVAAVPEPASWAMMIGGFALMGASMRRRSQVSFKLA